MKVEVHNLGVVKQAEIDLKPLTIFIGPNNTGKTWAAYALSAILGPYGWNQYRKAYAVGRVQKVYSPLNITIRQVLKEGSATIDMIQFADEYGEMYFNEVARLSRRWMREFMGTKRVSFEDLKVRVKMQETKKDFLERIRDLQVEGELSVGQLGGKALLSAVKEQGGSTLLFYTTKEGSIAAEELPIRPVRDFVVRNVFQVLHRSLYSYVYTFPTERTTFITFPWSPTAEAGEKAIKTSEISQQERRIGSLAQPIGSLLGLILESLMSSPSTREEQADDDPRIRAYIQLAQLLEERILSGGVDFSSPEPKPRRELLFQPAEGITLDMPVVSSMVKELSPLVLYLHYLAEAGEWLIIDEPEMNLHPEAQARLTEFLAMLVQAGLHVLITTHSPYMVDHLANLMKAAKHEDKEGIREKFYLQRAEAFIPREQVSVYLFGDGTAKNILDEEGEINWGTFSDISDQITQLYFEL